MKRKKNDYRIAQILEMNRSDKKGFDY